MKISIVLTAYNAEAHLRDTLNSFIAQTHSDWEAICIDDGSTDTTGDILDSYAVKDERIKVKHHHNKGPSECRNEGVELSTGEYITFCDADDMIAPHWFSNAATEISNSRPQLLRCHFSFADELPPDFFVMKAAKVERVIIGRHDCMQWSWQVFFTEGYVWLNFIRADLKPYIRFSDMRLKEDTMMLVNLTPHLTEVVQSNDCGYFYRRTPCSLSRSKRAAKTVQQVMDALSDIWKRQHDLADELGLLKELRYAIQKFADNDVIDWAINSAPESRAEKLLVRKSWKNLQSCCALDGSYSNRPFLYLPFQVWKVTGLDFQIKLTWKLYLVVRMMFRKKR